MRANAKPLAQQVLVLTSATSGLGVAIARAAAEAGASLLLTSGDELAVRKLAEDINASGGRAHAVAADLASAESCGRVARAAIARFGGFDAWITAGGDEMAGANSAREAAAQLRASARQGVVVHVSDRPLSAEIRRGLKTYGRAINLTHIVLPRSLKAFDIAAAAALYSLSHPVTRMTIGANGKLTAFTLARKHQGVLAGVGVLALAGVAIWVGRRTIADAAAPHVGRVVRPLVIEAARRRPLQAARLVAKHPGRALKLLQSLR